jgi:hypothetical protein
MERQHCKLWKKMDCQNSVFHYKKNVWRICLFRQTTEYDTENDVKSITV